MTELRASIVFVCLFTFLACGDRSGAPAESGREREAPGERHGASAETGRRVLDFPASELEEFGVRFAAVGPGALDLGFVVPGEIRPDPERIAAVAPLFPGIVLSVSRRVGQAVGKGDALAVVEGEQLARFEIRTRLSGIVLEQHVAPGEAATPDRPAFVVADLQSVWAVLAIPPADAARVRAGQEVRLREGAGPEAQAAIDYVAPVADPHTRAVAARVVLDNRDGRWRPGAFVTATVLDPVKVDLRVPNDAIVRLDGRSVVFVRAGEEIEARAVTLGRRGLRHTEIEAGLMPGAKVAHVGAFLLKAELEKGEGGGHHH